MDEKSDSQWADFERYKPKSPAWAKIDAKRAANRQKRKRKPRRPPIPTPYGSIPYAYTDKLQDAGVSRTTWALLFHLDRLIYGPARKEPLTLSAETHKTFRLSRHQVTRALRELEQTGLITVRRCEGRHNVVFPLWRRPIT